MKQKGLYLGYEVNFRDREETEPFYLPTSDLLTHCVILGMTGSGKTVLGKIILEETALKGIPSIAIDLKGDVSSLALVSSETLEEYSESWVGTGNLEVNLEKARFSVEKHLENLSKYGISKETVNYFSESVNAVVFTPRSLKGIPLAISPLRNPPKDVHSLWNNEPETVLNMVDMLARSFLSQIYSNDSPAKYFAEERFLATLIQYAWLNNVSLEGEKGLIKIIEMVQEPPIERIGVMKLDKYISRRKRETLAARINSLLIGAQQLWHVGEKLNINYLLNKYSQQGKTPLLIINLSEVIYFEDRAYVLSRVAYEIYRWMREKGGSNKPRLIFYVDEIGGGGGKTAFFPPHPYNPPSKPPLLLLVRQGRSFGMCCVLATQNPGDIDYRGLGNCGTWIIGKLTTEKDREKIIQGLSEAEFPLREKVKFKEAIVNLRPGEFIVKTRKGKIKLLRERWLITPHRTLSPTQIEKLNKELKLSLETGKAFAKRQIIEITNYVDNSLPLNKNLKSLISPNYLKNSSVLQVSSITISFHPYYLLRYNCFSQEKVGGAIITLESNGLIVVDAVKGEITDLKVMKGEKPRIGLKGKEKICRTSTAKPKTLSMEEMEGLGLKIDRFKPLKPRIKENEAKKIAVNELSKGLITKVQYMVGRKTRFKQVMPWKKDIEVMDAQLIRMPYINVILTYNDKTYERKINGFTGETIHDNAQNCKICIENPSHIICEDCGLTACIEHSRKCHVCGRNICSNCSITRGIIFKKTYCKLHA